MQSKLSELAPRVETALGAKLAWHAAVGAEKAAKALNAVSHAKLHQHLVSAEGTSRAYEPTRREHAVLTGKKAKLEGKLGVLAQLRADAREAGVTTYGGAPRDEEVRESVAALVAGARADHMRCTMASRDLELLMAPYERALANAHAAGGAIVALKKVARRGIDDDRPLLPPVVVPAGRGRDPAGQGRDPATDAYGDVDAPTEPLSHETRAVVRAAFGPLVRAGMQQLIIHQPPLEDAVEYLAGRVSNRAGDSHTQHHTSPRSSSRSTGTSLNGSRPTVALPTPPRPPPPRPPPRPPPHR